MLVRSLERRVEAAQKHVLLDLPVPLIGHEFLEPLGKSSEFGGWEAGDSGFKFFDAHARPILPVVSLEKERLPR